MRSVAVLPASALLAGSLLGAVGPEWSPAVASLLLVVALGWIAWWMRAARLAVLMLGAGYVLAGILLAASARVGAESAALDGRFGGFAMGAIEPAGLHPPLRTRVRLTEDAAPAGDGVRLRGVVEHVWLDGAQRRAAGGVLVTVSGASAVSRVDAWRAGRLIEAPITFRRPARYLTAGAGDAEAAAARQGIALLGRVKSGLSVEVVALGGWCAERASRVRAVVRRRVAAHVPREPAIKGVGHARAGSSASPESRTGIRAGVVTALLIGDRTAIPADVRSRLQAAGTYHVIAISGGNIAVIVVLASLLLKLGGAGPRLAAALAVPVLLAYAGVVAGGPSVRRAVIMATVHLTARAMDVRAPAWNTVAISAALLLVMDPLDALDAGFWLTFGATVALVSAGRLAFRAGGGSGPPAGGAGRGRPVTGPRHLLEWVQASVLASMLVELLILPVTLVAFSRVTLACVVANLVAVPAMTVAQVAGLAVAAGPPAPVADVCGRAAGAVTGLLLESSAIADWAPWFSPRVPPPPVWAWPIYAALLAAAWRCARPGRALAALCLAVGVWANWPPGNAPGTGRLSMTVLDVGQGDAILLRLPDGRAVLVDTGGGAAGGAEIGERVVGPALWARGIRRLDGLVITHADPDHVGGAAAIVRDFRPATVWTGIRVAGHEPTALLERSVRAAGVRQIAVTVEDRLHADPISIRVLDPARPDWERPKVRNDDSVVLEVRYGAVTFLLTGDAGVEVESALLCRLSAASVRVLKVGHHGSRTSTGSALVHGWPPHVAVVSSGRGNAFGHPAPEVLRRLRDASARVFRTDRDGEVTVETDGRGVTVRTFRSAAPFDLRRPLLTRARSARSRPSVDVERQSLSRIPEH
jgi:competence protein ComEC